MLGQIFQTFANCFRIPELRSRLVFTGLVLLVARLVALIPIPGLDGRALSAHFEANSGQGGVVGFYSLFTGGALEKCSVGSLGIMPYISATIIIQLLSDLLFSDILNHPLDKTVRNMNISPGLRFRHFYDTIFKRYSKVKRGCPFTLVYPFTIVIRNAIY
jgi:preprotein translocase subunit SecY